MSTNNEAVLQAVLSVLNSVGDLSVGMQKNHTQQLEALKASMMPEEWKSLLLNLDRKIKEDGARDVDMTKALQTLVSIMAPLSQQLVALTNSTNELVELQRQQNKHIQDIIETFIENTSRLESLTIATEGVVKASENTNVYPDLQGE